MNIRERNVKVENNWPGIFKKYQIFQINFKSSLKFLLVKFQRNLKSVWLHYENVCKSFK